MVGYDRRHDRITHRVVVQLQERADIFVDYFVTARSGHERATCRDVRDVRASTISASGWTHLYICI